MPQPSFTQEFSDQFHPPPVTYVDLTGKTAIVIGANTGIGLEAAKHFARMNPGRLILGCRSKERGEMAGLEINAETNYDKTEVWNIDLSKFSSVVSFAERVQNDGGRLDIVVANAGIAASSLEFTEDGWESTYQINYISGALLSLLLFPRMLETAKEYNTTPRITLVVSRLHYLAKFDTNLIDSPNALRLLGHKDHFMDRLKQRKYNGDDIYAESKLLGVYFARSFADRLGDKPLIINTVDPGFCNSSIGRYKKGVDSFIFGLLSKAIGRTPEEGSRQLVWAAVGGENEKGRLRGAFVDMASKVGSLSAYGESEAGRTAQDKLWDNLIEELTQINSNVQIYAKKYLSGPV
ncbi:Short chain dehydrogenase sol3 [Psilocybe cubensis]|uniref:NAD(P)-binding protein n=2 Tax=Psilocybe cubensis TaxID=181762 RepID=A0A8H7XTV8_PSICU|nr:Short chain dehydrogenase sol3 [Psilocybe cubensis]KAH9479750.1 Short chain dehydrogenase sol3 [Psilocybe cubensis]